MRVNPVIVAAVLLAAHTTAAATANGERIFEWQGTRYPYSIAPAGDSYHFHFDRQPASAAGRRQAKEHILQALFDDPSIDFSQREDYIRERATCSFFGGTFHDYTLCVLPNEYAPGKEEEFKGFVTRLPNSLGLISRFGLPVALGAGLLYLLVRRRAG